MDSPNGMNNFYEEINVVFIIIRVVRFWYSPKYFSFDYFFFKLVQGLLYVSKDSCVVTHHSGEDLGS